MNKRINEYMDVQEQLEKSKKDKSIKFPHLHTAIILYTKEIYEHKNEQPIELEAATLYDFILKFFNK